MNNLYQAIYSFFVPGVRITEAGDVRITEAGDTRITESDILLYEAIEGRLYLDVAPQQATFPYCIYSVDANIDFDFTDEREGLLLQFDIFSQNNSALEAGQLLELLKKKFDNCDLSVTNWRHIGFQRDFVIPNNDFSQVPPIIGYSVQYNALLEKQRS